MTVKSKLNVILSENAHKRVNGKQSSERTISNYGETLHAIFNILQDLGYKLGDPKNLSDRHVKAVMEEMYRLDRTPKTMQGYLSVLRIFAGWIGKKGLVKDVYYYLPNVPREELRVNTIAHKSKSWAEMGIDVQTKVEEANVLDPRLGLMLMAQVAFGLRCMEVLQMQPWKVDQGDKFAAYRTKGGRPRDIHIDTPMQRAVLDFIKTKTGKNEHLGWKTRPNGQPASLAFSRGRYYRLMARLGLTKAVEEVTGHGLRAQFAENAALLRGLIPMTLGGTGGQMPREDLDLTRLQVSELLGHSRKSITTAYYGSFGRETTPDSSDRAKHVIDACFKNFPTDLLKPVTQDRIAQCLVLSAEVMALGIYDDARKVQALWEHHSRRHAIDWLPPTHGSNLAALEAAAISIIRSAGGPADHVRALEKARK